MLLQLVKSPIPKQTMEHLAIAMSAITHACDKQFVELHKKVKK
jgi:hypothetical protein